MARLRAVLDEHSDEEHYLFTADDLSVLFHDLDYHALKALLSRSVKNGVLQRVCRSVYLNPRADYPASLLLYHTAAKLRSGSFTYLSLESVLSDAGVISQIPVNWITLMSSGRTYTAACGEYGSIEFIHTKRKPDDLADRLTYDFRIRLWRADVTLALHDMQYTRRPMDLIDWSAVGEFV